MPTAVAAQQAGPSRTSSIGEDDEERSPNGFNTSGSSFTKKLYDILDSSESCDIVCWTQGKFSWDHLPVLSNTNSSCYVALFFNDDNLIHYSIIDGTAFEVKEPKRLELEILPKYFRHARFQSFVRQLNFYSFKVNI